MKKVAKRVSKEDHPLPRRSKKTAIWQSAWNSWIKVKKKKKKEDLRAEQIEYYLFRLFLANNSTDWKYEDVKIWIPGFGLKRA